MKKLYVKRGHEPRRFIGEFSMEFVVELATLYSRQGYAVWY